MAEIPCPDCGGRRLRREVLAVTVGGLNISEFSQMPVTECLSFLDRAEAELTPMQTMIAGRIIKEIRARLGFLQSVGLQYLTLSRAAATLSGTLLRSAGDSRTPMAAGILMNLVNVVLNFLLIFPRRELLLFGLRIPMWGAGLGVVGAAAATALSFVLGGVLLLRALWRHKEISPRGYPLKPDKAVLLPCLKIAVPAVLQRFATSLGYVIFASLINSLGEVSTAAHTVANTVESAFYVPGYGMMTAAATLTGECIGARDRERLKKISTAVLVLETGLMLVSGALLFIFAPAMASLFSRDEQVVRLAAAVLRMVALSEPFYGVTIVLEGSLQGAGNTRVPFIFNVIGMWGVRIVGTFLLVTVLGKGLTAAWGAMIAHNLLLFVLYVLYRKYGRWNSLMK